MSLKNNTFLKYSNEYFIETGCYIGDGIDCAIEANFNKIISIELSNKYYQICVDKYKDNDKVNIILGDSAVILYNIIKDINSTITFWLDGHYSYGDTALGLYISPLIQELEQINKHHIKNHILIIDDVRLWNNVEFGWSNKSDVLNKIKEINNNYTIIFEDGEVENDILIAFVKN